MNEHITIGLYICSCGGEIADAVDIGALVERAHSFECIAVVRNIGYPCSPSGLKRIAGDISKNALNRIIIAGCSPRLMSQHFEKLLEAQGLNRNYVELVNIREQCANVHRKQKRRATAKALSMIRMGVAQVAMRKAAAHIESTIEPKVLVVGGGVSGLTAALSLAKNNVAVTLLEKERTLGGVVSELYKLYPSYASASSYIKSLASEVAAHPGIELVLNAAVTEIEGSIGQYSALVVEKKTPERFSAGCVILATGSRVYAPHGLFQYDSYENVVTQKELESLLRKKTFKPERIVMIQCVGSRIEERPYCSRICCTAAIKNAIILKERNPESSIVVLLRGVAEYVGDIERAREMGVQFVRYSLERMPQVEEKKVTAFDEISQEELSIDYDLVVLATPLIGETQNARLAQKSAVAVDRFGFLVEPHIKLRPGKFAPEGVFVAGAAHFPADISECVAQAHRAASKAHAFLARGSVKKERLVVSVDDMLCRGCGNCQEICEFNAIKVKNTDENFKLARVDTMLCKGCGLCAVNCISGALEMSHYTDAQIDAQIEASLN